MVAHLFLLFKHTNIKQCDQTGQFLKTISYQFSYKVARVFGDVFCSFKVLNNFGENWATLPILQNGLFFEDFVSRIGD